MQAPEQLRDRILAFVADGHAGRTVMKEEGEMMPLEPGRFSVEAQHGKVLLQVWNDDRSVVRRILDVKRESNSEMVLAYQRFGAGEGRVRLLRSEKRDPELQREVTRGQFAARLRKLLSREFPGWRVEQLSSERDLERSLSVHVTRATLSRGSEVWAVAGCAEEEGEAASSGALAQGLIWLDGIRRRFGTPGTKKVVAGLKLFVPERFVDIHALRCPFLNSDVAQFELLAFSAEDDVRTVDEANAANLATELPLPTAGAMADAEGLNLIRRLGATAGVELVVRSGLGVACRIHGLEFARAAADGAWFGYGDDSQPLTRSSLEAAERLAAEIVRIRAAGSPDRHHSFYTAQPERWLESLLARDVSVLDSDLDPRFVYSQVPAVAGRERGIIDLLAATRDGRLVVIELKAAPDPNLPLQALDYWMRVKWHFERGSFHRLGYFSGLELRPEPPQLWLVAPVFEFHSTTDAVLRYLSPAVPIRRIGLNHTWREGIRVVDRQ